MIDARLLAFRAEEAAARSELEVGCRGDLQHVDSILAIPVRKARIELESYLESLGTIQPRLAASLGAKEAKVIAQNCANSVFANASIRFRARFRTYAELFANAERRFVETATIASSRGRRPLRAVRQIAIPRIDLCDSSVFPYIQLSPPDADPWTLELKKRLQSALELSVYTARQKLLARGERQLLRTLAAVRLVSLAERHQSTVIPAPVRPNIRS